MAKKVKTTIETGLRVLPVSSSSITQMGDLEVLSVSGKLNYHNGTTASPIVTESHSATITNKTIDLDNNILSNIETDNLKSGVLNTNTSLTGASDTQIPSALAVKTYIDNGLGAQNEASEITLVPYGSVTATDVQVGIEQLDDNVNTRALASDLSTHISDTSTHGTSSDIVGISDTQTITNKTFNDEMRMSQIATPSNPSAGFNKLYFKNNNKLYKKHSDGTELEVGHPLIAVGSKASPSLITSSGITAPSYQRSVIYIAGDGGVPVDVTNNPQISDGVNSEQEIILVGTSNTATVSFTNGNNLILNGDITLTDYDSLHLRWDGDNWVEVARNS